MARGGDVPAVSLALVSLIGILSHTYGCTANDLADIESDRLNASRKASVLVTGAISPRSARTALVVQLAAAQGLAVFAVVILEARWYFVAGTAALFISVTVSNVFQKRRIAHPLAMDTLFGLNMGVPALLCCALLPTVDLTPALLVGAAFAIHMVLLNVVAGNLKDLEHDRAVGDDTTALRLRVRLTDDRLVLSTPVHRRLVALLVAGSLGSLLALTLLAPVPLPQRVALSAAVCLLHLLTARSVRTLLTGHRPVSPNGREASLGLNFLSLMLASSPWAPVPVLVVAVVTAAWLPLTRPLVTTPSHLIRSERP
ncbi:UbiA family prenyltransferase [Streptomyces sp. AK02-01A]|uniref:UbiA family prenyltransferase n=1 Tax=Streptomyces sp. AK02-01A TaxID=3028648 RepID=UPI0029A21FA9|nr:UbiA family prenyltransferase [Streptomyces sp. AK02-01A]MDX3854750.1 UbiA family prenyltransferase [Streptomyces sp. AK02-01A]